MRFVFTKQNLQGGSFSNRDGGGASIGGRGDNRDGHACKEAAGGSGNGSGSGQDMEIAKSENREHPAYAGVRAFKEVRFAFVIVEHYRCNCCLWYVSGVITKRLALCIYFCF